MSHVIDELVVALTVGSGNHGMRDDANVGRLVTAVLLPVVEEVLDAFDGAGSDVVMVLPLLELDLGSIRQSDYDTVAPARLRAALEDALQRAFGGDVEHGAAAAADGAASDRVDAPTILSRHDAALARLARFLEAGIMPWHAGADASGAARSPDQAAQGRLHEALLERVLAGAGASTWDLLARALSDPRQAGRLVEQFSPRLLLDCVRGAALAGRPLSTPLLAALSQAGRRSAKDEDWRDLLAACVDGERGATAAATDATDATITAATGTAAAEAQSGPAVPVTQGGRHGAAGSGPAYRIDILRAGWGAAASKHAFVAGREHGELIALLRDAAGGFAGDCEALIEQATRWPPVDGEPAVSVVWVQLLSACMGQGSDAASVCARIRAAQPSDHLAHAGGRRSDTEVLAHFRAHGAMPARATGVGALAQALSTKALGWCVENSATADVAAARAYRAQVRDEYAQPTVHGHASGRVDGVTGQSARTATCAPGDGAGVGLPSVRRRDSHAMLSALLGFISAAGLGGGAPAGPAADVALGHLLAHDSAAAWSALARALLDPGAVLRLAKVCSREQIEALLRRLAPSHATRLQAILAGMPASDAALRSPASDPIVETVSAATRGGTQLARLTGFLRHGGALGGGAAAGERGHHALLASLCANANDVFWLAIADALDDDDSATRLLTLFPHRQLRELVERGAPDHARALTRMLARADAMAVHDGHGAGPLAQMWWRHTLAACAARSGAGPLPWRIAARVALALEAAAPDGRPRARGWRPAGRERTPLWRLGAVERRARRALIRLGTMLSASHEASPIPAAAAPPATAASGTAPGADIGLLLHQRERLARSTIHFCGALGSGLARRRDIECEWDADSAASADHGGTAEQQAAPLRAAIADHVGASLAIPPPRRQALLDAIDIKAAGAAQPASFLRAVLEALLRAAPIDLDAIFQGAAVPAPPRAIALEAMISALRRGDTAAAASRWRLLLGEHAAVARDALRHYCRSAAVRRALALSMPAALLLDIAGLLDPAAPALLDAVLTPAAPLRAQLGDGAARAWSDACQLHALRLLTVDAPANGSFDAAAFLRSVTTDPGVIGAGVDQAELARCLPARWRDALAMVASPADAAGAARRTNAGAARHTARAAPLPRASAFQRDAAPADPTEPLAVANAGMVLAAPYLPRLFGALDLMADGAFLDASAAARAVHLLQFMVTGQTHTPEYELTLNKVLCGVAAATPVAAGIDITEAERDTIIGLIEAMVAHAKVLGTTSVEAMRQTFFARQGDLQLLDDAWQLRVHPGPFDMLLDRLPWSYALIKFGPMTRPLHVAWRPT